MRKSRKSVQFSTKTDGRLAENRQTQPNVALSALTNGNRRENLIPPFDSRNLIPHFPTHN